VTARLACVLAAGLLVGGCVPDLAPWTLGSGRARDAGLPTDGTCERRIHVDTISLSDSGCFLDQRVEGRDGVLRYPCAGGSAVATVEGATFVGSSEGDAVDVELSSSYEHTAGCTWITTQVIRGSLSSGTLEYRYSEAPSVGESGCASACYGTARVTLD
jgi:hypothetical protein